jgi:hypothetical protein
MSALRGLVGGVLTLTLLEAAISTDKAANNASGLIKLVTGGLARIIDPAVALIPDRRSRIQGQGGNPIVLAN